MKNIIKKSILTICTLIGFLFVSCETTDLSVVDSPNAVSPDAADVDLFLNSVQIGLTNFISGREGENEDGMSEFGMEPVRMLHGFGPSYRELNEPADFDQVWATAYSETLADIRAMNNIAIPGELYTHVAMGQVIEAYIMMTLVDFFGDVPYSEAILGEANFNPILDSGSSVYEAVDLLLIDAIANFNLTEFAAPVTDLYFGGNESQWIKLANTLRLKLYLQTRLVDTANSTNEINALIAGGNLLLSSADDFQFQYSTNLSAPDSRHPFFEKNYTAGPNSDFYMSNYYMDLLANNYSLADPRTRYYFYRQVNDFSGANVVTKDCVTQSAPAWYVASDIYCIISDVNGFGGFWGRDHLDPDGIPPDNSFVTFPGIYPYGGAFDDNTYNDFSGPSITAGLQGAGITPIMLSSFTNFMLAEAALTLGTTGDAAVYLEAGIRESITKTITFGASLANSTTFVPINADIETYIMDVLTEYNAGTDTDKLKVLVEQYFIALWGNGIEAYNTYRRTGQPADIQPSIELEDPGVFVRSHFYPANAADGNINITQKADVSTPVFWDINPEGFVD